jgi:hypothetical protein
MTSEPPAPNIQSLTEELERLKNEQAKAMGLAVYVGMSKQELKLYDERQKRIYELYDALLALKGPATQS